MSFVQALDMVNTLEDNISHSKLVPAGDLVVRLNEVKSASTNEMAKEQQGEASAETKSVSLAVSDDVDVGLIFICH
jgi:hypothetical protein